MSNSLLQLRFSDISNFSHTEYNAQSATRQTLEPEVVGLSLTPAAC